MSHVAWSAVSVLGTRVSGAVTGKPIEMPFWSADSCWSKEGTIVLDGGQDRTNPFVVTKGVESDDPPCGKSNCMGFTFMLLPIINIQVKQLIVMLRPKIDHIAGLLN